MTFVTIDQDGKIGKVNSDHVALILPHALVGQSQIFLANGMGVVLKGTVEEITARLEGKPVMENKLVV
jgi:hypothetical protein